MGKNGWEQVSKMTSNLNWNTMYSLAGFFKCKNDELLLQTTLTALKHHGQTFSNKCIMPLTVHPPWRIKCLATYHEGRRFSLACFLVCLGSTVPHTHHCRSMQNSCHCPTSTYLLESAKERRIFLVNESSIRQSDNTHVYLHVHTQCLKSLHRSS